MASKHSSEINLAVGEEKRGEIGGKRSGTHDNPSSHNDVLLVEENQAFDIQRLRERNRLAFLNILSAYIGKKTLVLDPSLSAPLSLVAQVTDLKQHGVDAWCKLGNCTSHAVGACSTVIFVVRPEAKAMKVLAQQASDLQTSMKENRADFDKPTQDAVHMVVVFVPRPSEACVKALHHFGHQIVNDLEIRTLPLYFIPLDRDILSLELPNTFKNFHCSGDSSSLVYAAEGVDQLQQMFGINSEVDEMTSLSRKAKGNCLNFDHPEASSQTRECGVIPNIRAIGSAARYVADTLLKLRKEKLQENARETTGTQDLEAAESAPPVPPVRRILSGLKQSFPEDCAGSSAGFGVAAKKSPLWNSSVIPKQIKTLVILDRRVDLITPLCTPFTYEALLDHFFGIDCTYIQPLDDADYTSKNDTGTSGRSQPFLNIGSELPKPSSSPKTKPQRVCLNSHDTVFLNCRDLHQSELGTFLHCKAGEIQDAYNSREELKTISDINQFMKTFKVKQVEHASLAIHVKLASAMTRFTKEPDFHKKLMLEDMLVQSSRGPTAMASTISAAVATAGIGVFDSGFSSKGLEELETLIAKGTDIQEVYRLCCIFSIVQSGLPSRAIQTLRQAIVQQYGYHEVERLCLLETCGMFRGYGKSPGSSSSGAVWDNIKKRFNLIVETQEAIMKDIAYVCSGYAPLSVRLIQLLHSLPLGWRSCPQALNLLWGPAIEITQQTETQKGSNALVEHLPPVLGGKFGTIKRDVGAPPEPLAEKEVVLLLFLGGITYTEIAAVRRLKLLENNQYDYIIATTEIINSRKFINSFRSTI